MRIRVYTVTIGDETHEVRARGDYTDPFGLAYSKLHARARALGLSDPEEIDRDNDSHIYSVDRYDADGNLTEEVAATIALDHYFDI